MATRRLRRAANREPAVADPELLTTSQVLALLQIGRTKLWELVREAAFPAYRIGEGRNSSLRYRRADVLGWLERSDVDEPTHPGLHEQPHVTVVELRRVSAKLPTLFMAH